MTLVQWSPQAGETMAMDVALAVGAVPGSAPVPLRPYISATRRSALDLALSLIWSADVLLVEAGIKPLPSELAPLLPGPDLSHLSIEMASGARVGDVLELSRGDLTQWTGPRGADGLLVLPAPQAAILAAYAMRRAARLVVQSARPYAGGAPMLDEDRIQIAPLGSLGAIPLVLVVGVVVLGAAAIAAHAWGNVEEKRSDVALRVAELEQAAKVKVACDLARLQISAGKSVSIPDVLRGMGQKELVDTAYLPTVAVGIGALAVGTAAWLKWRSRGTAEAARKAVRG